MNNNNLDTVIDLFLLSMKETASAHNIELMEDAIANAKSAFSRNWETFCFEIFILFFGVAICLK
jgi:hypothetical protein